MSNKNFLCTLKLGLQIDPPFDQLGLGTHLEINICVALLAFLNEFSACCNILKLVQKLVPGPDPILKYFQITLACSNIFKGVGLRRVSVCSFN